MDSVDPPDPPPPTIVEVHTSVSREDGRTEFLEAHLVFDVWLRRRASEVADARDSAVDSL
jgi:hypothetical protein